MWFRALNPWSTWFSPDPKDWPLGSVRRTHFGQHVLWHRYVDGGRHLTAEELSVYRQIGDFDVDPILDLIAAAKDENTSSSGTVEPGQDVLEQASLASIKTGHDVVHLSVTNNPRNDAKALDTALVNFYQQYSELPSWVDMDQLHRGQEVFLAYLPAISLSLYYRSLVPGFSIPPLAHVLLSTGYLAPPATKQRVMERLTDTGALLVQCMADGAAIVPGSGAGWKACLQVRILHAKVRRALLQRSGERSWDTKRHGIPINEEDMAATLLTFSVNALVGVEILLGFPLSVQERRDYLALWRYLGWLLGVRVSDNDHVPNHTPTGVPTPPRALDPCGRGWVETQPDSLKHSYAMFQSILLHLLHPEKVSIQVAHHLLWQGRVQESSSSSESMNDETNKQNKPSQQQEQENWFYYRCLQCRRFVGNPLADALQLPLNPKLWYQWRTWIFSSCMLSAISLYTYLALPWSPLRQRIVRFHQSQLESFALKWTEEHRKRVEKQLPKGAPTCPFAMLFPPST